MTASTLLSEVALKHPEWLLSFLRWLRHDAGIRTNALTLAADAVWLRLQIRSPSPGHQPQADLRRPWPVWTSRGDAGVLDLDLRQGDPQARQARCRRRGR